MLLNCKSLLLVVPNLKSITMSNESFNFGTFIKGSVSSIVKPKEYFSSLQADGGLGVPVVKALIYGALSGIFAFLWSILNVSGLTGGLFGGAIGILGFIWAIVGAIIGLFIGAVIVLIISAICGGSTDYVANARVTASLMVLIPVSSFFGFLTGINFFLSMVVGLLINMYGLYMLYFALIGPLKGKEGSAKIFTWILVAILALFLVIGFFTKRVTNKFLDQFDIDTEELMQMGNDLEEGLKDLTKDLEEALDEIVEESKE